MARYRVRQFNGKRYGLRPGETIEQLAALEDLSSFWKVGDLSPRAMEIVTDVKTDYLVSKLYGLVPRSSYKRAHRKRGFLRGTKEVLPRLEGEPEVLRPKFGKLSGRSGGGRGAACIRFHSAFRSGNKPGENCLACQVGLREARMRKQEEFFDYRNDSTLRKFINDIPEDIQERFLEPCNHATFIGRWKTLPERGKRLYLNMAVSFEEEKKEFDRQWRVRRLEELKRQETEWSEYWNDPGYGI